MAVKQVISLSDKDSEGISDPHEDALVISIEVNYDVKRILVDNNSYVDILYYHAYQRMNLYG